MKLQLKFLVFALLVVHVKATDYHGFKTINISNLKGETKCSGVVFKTSSGCRAVTNAHCVKELAIDEHNLIVSQINDPGLKSQEEKNLFSSLFFVNLFDKRSYLIKAKPSADLAEIYFDKKWAPDFCENSKELNLENVDYYRHINETNIPVFTPGLPQQTPLRNIPTQGPNRAYRDYQYSKNQCFISLGYQFDSAHMSSVAPIEIKDMIGADGLFFCPLWNDSKAFSRLNVNHSSLPGLDYMLKVTGINLSQGMSGGALIVVEDGTRNIEFHGLASSVYPFMWQSNFIRSKEVFEFLEKYEDDFSDKYLVEYGLKNSTTVSDDDSDLLAKKVEELRDALTINVLDRTQYQSVENDSQDIFELLGAKREREVEIRSRTSDQGQSQSRVRNIDRAFGDTDQNDVGGGNGNCSLKQSKIDPYFHKAPSITGCFDLSQTRFQHSGVLINDFRDSIVFGYQDSEVTTQIDSLMEFRKLLNRDDFDRSNLLIRNFGEYPIVEVRKNILNEFSGYYTKLYNSTGGDYASYNYLNEDNSRFFVIKPSFNSLLNESVELVENLQIKDDVSLFNHEVINKIENSLKGDVSFDIGIEHFNIELDLATKERFYMNLIPRFEDEYKKIILQGEIIVRDYSIDGRITKRIPGVKLECDNLSPLKLICSNDILEIGLSKKNSKSRPTYRISFWKDLLNKKEALLSGTPYIFYNYGHLWSSYKAHPSMGIGISFRDLKLKDFLEKDDVVFHEEPEFGYGDFELSAKIAANIKCDKHSLSIKTFAFDDDVYHVVHNQNSSCRKRRGYGEVFSTSFESLGYFIKGRFKALD